MTVGISTAVKNSALSGIRTLIDAGSGAGKIKIYTTPRPATGVAITTQTLLAELTMQDPSFAEPASAVMTMNVPVSDSSANATGTAVWARITDSNDNFVMDIDVGDLSSGAELKLPSTSISLGGAVNVISGSISIS